MVREKFEDDEIEEAEERWNRYERRARGRTELKTPRLNSLCIILNGQE